MVQAQSRVLGRSQAQVRVQLLPQDQVLGQAQARVQGQKQVRLLGLGPDQDREAIKDQALARDMVRVMVRVLAEAVAVAPVKVLVMVKAVAMAQDLGTGMENEDTCMTIFFEMKRSLH